MITKWGLKNFKSIRETNPELELAPLTVITGVNSSGKSSLLQSIAMLAQSARNNDKTKRITLRGEDEKNENILIDLGEFKDIYCNNPCKTSKNADEDSKNNIVIAFSISSKEYEYIHYEFLFNKYGYFSSNSEAKTLHMECKEKDKSLAFMNLDPSGVYETISPLEESNVFDPASENEIKEYHHKNVELDYCTESYRFFNFLPDGLSFYLDKIEDEDINKILTLLIDVLSSNIELNEKYILTKMYEHKLGIAFVLAMLEKIIHIIDESFLASEIKEKLARNIPDWYRELSKLDEQKKKKIIEELDKNDFKVRLQENSSINTYPLILPSALAKATNYLNEYFESSVKYLGPLREDPKWKYDSISSNVEIDPKGKNTPAVIHYLNEKREDIINYFSPRNFDSLDKTILPKINFSEALVDCLSYISLSDDFKTKNLGADIFDIKLVIGDNEFAIPQLGTGVSQILPILVICLSAALGSTIIIEQPELHLHPKMQSKLADFFIAMSQSDRQIIIETHSEHIINALRHRIATTSSQADKKLADDIRIYFIEKNENGSQFIPITINEYGAISDWPEDFFDESSKSADGIFNAAIFKWEKRKND